MAPIEHLTEPQRECLRLVARQYNTKEIAGRLGVSPSAVDKRIERAVQLLEARSRFDAARMLARHEADAASDPLPWQPFDVPTIASPAASSAQDGRGPVRRLVGFLPLGRSGGDEWNGARNRLTKLQRLGVMAGLTMSVAVSSMVVLNMAFTLSRLIWHYQTVHPR